MTYTLLHGNCLDIMRDMDLSRVGVVIADPPYGGKTYATDLPIGVNVYREWISMFKTVAIFGYPENLMGLGVKPAEWVTWWPTNKFGGRAKERLPKEHECIAIYGNVPGADRLFRPRVQNEFMLAIHKSRGKSLEHARLGDVWRDPSPGSGFLSRLRKHPNEKPLSLMEKLVLLCSNEGDTVLDPFMGSGTTGAACIKLGRNFIGIELDERFYAVAKNRIDNTQPALIGSTALYEV